MVARAVAVATNIDTSSNQHRHFGTHTLRLRHPNRATSAGGRMAGMRRRGHLGSEADRATFRALHQASLASPALREGLTPSSAERAIKHLRTLLGTPALALTDTATTLAWDGS